MRRVKGISKVKGMSKVTMAIFCVLIFIGCQREMTPVGSDYANGNDEVDTEYVECNLEVNENDKYEDAGHDYGLENKSEDYPLEDGVVIRVYAPDANFLNFEAVDTSIKLLTYENVLKALVEQEILPQDVKILSFGNTVVDGEKMLEIDFSEEFSTFIKNQGTSGEFLTLGGVVNTFLYAFGGEKVMITVDGGPLATLHVGEILEPMSWFGN